MVQVTTFKHIVLVKCLQEDDWKMRSISLVVLMTQQNSVLAASFPLYPLYFHRHIIRPFATLSCSILRLLATSHQLCSAEGLGSVVGI